VKLSFEQNIRDQTVLEEVEQKRLSSSRKYYQFTFILFLLGDLQSSNQLQPLIRTTRRSTDLVYLESRQWVLLCKLQSQKGPFFIRRCND
jgi:hypothetical protein